MQHWSSCRAFDITTVACIPGEHVERLGPAHAPAIAPAAATGFIATGFIR